MFIELEKIKEKYDNHLVDVNDIENNIKSLDYLMQEFIDLFEPSQVYIRIFSIVRHDGIIRGSIGVHDNKSHRYILNKISFFLQKTQKEYTDLYDLYKDAVFKYHIDEYDNFLSNNGINSLLNSMIYNSVELTNNDLNNLKIKGNITNISKRLNFIKHALVLIITKFKYVSINTDHKTIMDILNTGNIDGIIQYKYKNRVILFDKNLPLEYIRNEIYKRLVSTWPLPRL